MVQYIINLLWSENCTVLRLESVKIPVNIIIHGMKIPELCVLRKNSVVQAIIILSENSTVVCVE